MTFELELQSLVDKYDLAEVTVTYKKSVTLSANPTSHVPPTTAFVAPPFKVDEDELSAAAKALVAPAGPIGRIT